MSEWYVNPIFDSYWVVAALTLFLLGMLAWGVTARRITVKRGMILAGLRGAIILLMVLAMLRPTYVYTEMRKLPATLVLLVDRSRSMLVADAFGGKKRWEAVQAVLAEVWPTLGDLADDLEIKLYTFDAEAYPQEFGDTLDLGAAPDGKQTAIGAVIKDVLDREAGKRLAGVVLLSDGAQQAQAPRDVPPQTSARRLADLGCPLYTVVFGKPASTDQARDVSLSDLVVNSTVFVKNELTAAGTVSVNGFVNQDLTVQLLFETSPGKMEVVGSKTVRPTQDGEQITVELGYVPPNAGEYKLTLQVVEQPGELVKSNNRLSTFVTVLKGGLSALYLEGELRVESRFLRQSLDASADINVDFQWFDQRRRSEWPVDLSQLLEKKKYDVYIIGDLDSNVFRKEDLEAIRKAVENGAGLLMLGGYHSFWAGGYQRTPLAQLLPLEVDDVDRLVRQNFDERARSDLHVPGPLAMRPAPPLGTNHPLMQLAPGAQNLKAWEDLPPLDGANDFRRLKPTAKVLAESPRGDELIVADDVGQGRVLVFAGDSTWHWWLEGHEAAHKRFWRQAILWLARKTADSNVWVKLEQARFAPNQRVDFTVGAQSPEGEPVNDAVFQAEVTTPGGTKQPLRLARQGDEVSGSFVETQEPGDYTIRVTATHNGKPYGSAQARFLIDEQDMELANAAARSTLMAALANMTQAAGGRSLAPEQLPDLIEQLKKQPVEQVIEAQSKYTPWDSWPFMLALVGLFSGEWYLRKRWGLV